jgi:regulator of protease activity HflC (stomatin/prohibitin superfamily)
MVVINDCERGFLFRNGRFVRMLNPGGHFVPSFLGYKVTVLQIGDEPITNEITLATYGKDKNFLDSITRTDVMDGQIALHYADGRYKSGLEKGVYVFWNVFKTHTFNIIDMSDDASIAEIPPSILETLPSRVCKKVKVEEWEAVLLYVDGTFVRKLKTGIHYFWQNGRNLSCVVYDMRTTQVTVSGQEILTSDKVELRVNFICSYRIVDPVQINLTLKDYSVQIYAAAQLALRELFGNMRFDEILENKSGIADEVLKLIKLKEKELFVEFLSAGMKDIILPGEVREIMNTVLIAEKRAQANVITRREEVASTRSLLNTARLMDENTTLYKLKELEYLERICDKVGSIQVSGASNLLDQLRAIMKVSTGVISTIDKNGNDE